MNKTKKKILTASLTLFNEHGLLNVSQRRITDYLKISPGNLTYHFKKKEDISAALYFEFIDIITAESKKFLAKNKDLPHFARLIESWFSYMYQYRFIFFDITNLMRMNEKIATNYEQFIKVRASIFLKMANKAIEDGILREEEIPNEYENLYSRLHIVSDYYLSYLSSEKMLKLEQQKKHKNIFLQAIFPFLTKKGKDTYMGLFKT